MEKNSFKEIEEEANMIARKTKLRIQLASSTKLSLKNYPSRGTKGVDIENDTEESSSPDPYPLGRVLRSCFAAVEAMSAVEENDHRADNETTEPSQEIKFKASLAAVQAVIENEQESEFLISTEISSKAEIPETTESTSEEDNTEPVATEIESKSRRKRQEEPDLPDDETVVASEENEDSKAEEEEEEVDSSATEQETAPPPILRRGRTQKQESKNQKELATEDAEEPSTESQQVEQRPTGRRGRSARQQPVEDELPQETLPVPEEEEKEEIQNEEPEPEKEKRRPGRPAKKKKKIDPKVDADDADGEEEASSPPIKAPPGRRGRLRNAQQESSSSSPTEKTEVQPEVVNTESQSDAEQQEDTAPKRRGRPKKAPSSSEESLKEDVVLTKEQAPVNLRGRSKQTSELSSSDDLAKIEDQVSPVSKDQQEDSSTEVETDTEKPRKRGRPRAPEPQTKARPTRGKKTVLKVALPLRSRSAQPEAPAVEEASPATPSSASASPSSPRTLSPKARVVKVSAKRKEPRSSHGSDTDTADETLDEEKKLSERQAEKEASAIITAPSIATGVESSVVSSKVIVARAATTTYTTAPVATTAAAGVTGAPKPTLISTAGGTVPAIRTITVRMPSPRAGAASSSGVKKIKLDDDRPKVPLFDAAAAVPAGGKRDRKRKAADNASTASDIGNVNVVPSSQPKQTIPTSKPTVTIVSPMVISKPNVTIVTPQAIQTSTGQLVSMPGGSGVKPIVIQVPPNGMRPNLPGVKTVMLPKFLSRPRAPVSIAPQIRSIRVTAPSAGPTRTSTPIMSRVATQHRFMPSPIRLPGVPFSSGNVIIRTMTVPGHNTIGGQATRIVSHPLATRPSIIRSPRLITTFAGTARPRIISLPGGPQRVYPIRATATMGTVQPIRTTQPPLQSAQNQGKVILRTIAPMVPQRHITVQATPSQPTSSGSPARVNPTTTSANVIVQRPKVPNQLGYVIRPTTQSSARVIVKPTEAGRQLNQQPQTIRKPIQQVVKPLERKQAVKRPAPARKPVQKTQQPISQVQSTSAVEKLLEEPQMPKKKPLSKKQRNMRKTDLIKTSTRSRRRGVETQIDYNEDRMGGLVSSDESNSPDESLHSEEMDSSEQHIIETEEPEEAQRQQPQQDNIPVAVVEVFLSEEEIKLTEIHSPSKQELVDISHQQQQEQQHSQTEVLGGQGAPEGFFTTEEGIVEGVVEGPFESVELGGKGNLVASGDNAFAKAMMIGEDSQLMKKKMTKRKGNPLAKD